MNELQRDEREAPLAEPALSPRRRRIFLMRHGSVTYFDGSGKPILPESVPLNEIGRVQASAAGSAFAELGLSFDRVIASGLPRTVETAKLVLAKTGQDIAIEIWPELQEIRGGRLSAIPEGELREAFLGAFEGVVPEDKRFLGGESIGELLDRVLPALDKLRADAAWDTVLLVLHGGVNRAILSRALTGQRLFFGNLSQAPACINALDVGANPHDWVVRMTNYAPTDVLQPTSRRATMEVLFDEYLKYRNPV